MAGWLIVLLGLASHHPATAQESAAVPDRPPPVQPPEPVTTDGARVASATTPPLDVEVTDRQFQVPSLVLPSSHLLGDWSGVRTRLEEQGLKPTVTWVADFAGNPVGGRAHGFTEAENLGLDLVYDLQRTRGIPGGAFHVSLSERTGNSLSNEYVGNYFCTQQVFGGETFRVVNVEYDQSMLDGVMDVSLGRIAAGDDFLASPYYWLFMQNGFDGNPVAIFKNAPGMSGYPNAAWGARLRVRPTERTYAMVGIYDGDSDIRANDRHGLDWSMRGPAFLISEVGYILNGQPDDEGLLGHYKAGLYYDADRFAQFSLASELPSAAAEPAKTVRGNWGFYVLGDQVIWQIGGKGSPRGLGVFGSVIVAPDESTNQLPFFCNGGLGLRGLFASRPTDTLAFGVVYGRFSHDLRAAQRLARQFDPAIGVQTEELVFEWGYRMRLRDGAAFFQPDLQYIVNPGGAGQYPNALVIGAQTGVYF